MKSVMLNCYVILAPLFSRTSEQQQKNDRLHQFQIKISQSSKYTYNYGFILFYSKMVAALIVKNNRRSS